MEESLIGLVVSLIIVLVVAVRFATARLAGRRLVAKAVVLGVVTFASGLVAAATVTVLGPMIMNANGLAVIPVSTLTHVRVVVCVAALLAVAAVFALVLGVLVRRAWVGIVVAISTVVLPYLLAALPLLPTRAADWLLRLTPAAAFAVEQTIQEYPQVTAHYAPSAGYLPLPGWAGLAILCGYTAVLFGLALRRSAPGPFAGVSR